MEKATDKQINYAKTLGIEDPESFSKQALSELIDKKIGTKGKLLIEPQIESVIKNGFKPKFDTSSYYVAYAKDLCVAMLQANPTEDIATLMNQAIQCILAAKKAF